MQYSTDLLTALMALLASVSGLALPATPTKAPCVEELPQYQQLKANQSTVFGWQLSGSAKDQNELDSYCTKLGNGEYDKWSEEGLITADIQIPICNSKSTSPNATIALPSVVAANTKLFETLLLNSLPSSNKTAWSYLCDNLRYVQLDGFLLNSASIINSTCNAGNDLLNPQPFSASASVNETAVNTFNSDAGTLFAYIYASSANSSSELNQLCTHAPDYKASWNTLLLNATAVEDTICSIKQPLTVADAKGKITEWTSRVFANVIENISNAVGYHDFLCENLSCEGMTNVGMDGELVRDLVCEDASARTTAKTD